MYSSLARCKTVYYLWIKTRHCLQTIRASNPVSGIHFDQFSLRAEVKGNEIQGQAALLVSRLKPRENISENLIW